MNFISASGSLLTSFSDDSRQKVYEQIAKDMAEAIKQEILLSFDNSVKLAALIGQRADQEALRAIYRSIKINVKSSNPLLLEVEFKDDYSHWYGGEELPQEVADALNNIIESSVKNWFTTTKPGDVALQTMLAS